MKKFKKNKFIVPAFFISMGILAYLLNVLPNFTFGFFIGTCIAELDKGLKK